MAEQGTGHGPKTSAGRGAKNSCSRQAAHPSRNVENRGSPQRPSAKKTRAAPVARPACICWFNFYFNFVFVVLLFLGAVAFPDFESSSRTVAESFAVSIL